MFGASHGRCGSVFWSLSVAEVHQPSDSRSAEVLGPSFLQKNPAFRLRSMTGIFFCTPRLYKLLISDGNIITKNTAPESQTSEGGWHVKVLLKIIQLAESPRC